MKKVVGSSESSAGNNSCLRRSIDLIYSLTSLSHSIKVFTGKWQVMRNRLDELNSGLIAAESCDPSDCTSLSGLISAITDTLNDCHGLARRCIDMSYSGKLLMQSDLDAVAGRIDRHVNELAGMFAAGIVSHHRSFAIVVSKPGFGASREDMRFYATDLVARMKIGSCEMKTQALAALNDAMEEEERYAGIAAVEIGQTASLLASFVDSPEAPGVQEEAAAAVALISGFDSCRNVLIAAGVVAPLVRALESGTELGKERAARALQKLTRNSDNAWSVSAHGGVTALLRICAAAAAGGSGGEMVSLACGVLKNLSGVEEIKRFMVEEGAITAFVNLARSRDELLQIISIDLLQFFAFGDESIRQLVIAGGGIQVLTQILSPKEASSSSFSSKKTELGLRAIEGLCFPSPSCVNILISHGFLNHLLVHLRSGGESGSIQEQALKIAVKLCASSGETRKAMGEAGFMPELVRMLGSKTFEVREMAAEAVAGMVSVSRNRRRFLQ